MNIIHHRAPMPRRTFLKGAGITLAHPWLDAMSVRTSKPCGAISPSSPDRTSRIPAA